MNNCKCLNKVVHKRCALLTVYVAVVLLAVAIIVSVLCGVNYGAGLDNSKMITVSVNSYVYNNGREELEKECESVFAEAGLDVEYVYRSEMNGDNREIAYVFDADVDSAKLEDAKNALETKLKAEANKNEEDGVLGGAMINVASSSEEVKSGIVSSRLWRSAIAVGVFAILSFIYVSIRHRVGMGLIALITPIVTAALSTAIILLVRIPVTNAIFYATLVSMMVAAAFMMIVLNKIANNRVEGGEGEELVKGSLATVWIGWTSVALGVALVLVGAIATSAVRYFALAALVGVVVAAFIGLIFVPSATLWVEDALQKKAAGKTASGYVGAKKTETVTTETKEDADKA